MMRLGVGDSFAGYDIEGVLGEGGMGTVYLARHPRLPMQVALKLLVPTASADKELRQRFEQEAGVIARLEHPNIVDVYDCGATDGHLWIAMQYIRGGHTGQLTPHNSPPGRTLSVIAQTGDALDYAHSCGILHRDVKPANILLAAADAGREERAVLTDFGIARLMESDAGLTADGSYTATIAYASPEQLSSAPVDHRSDQYSLACTLFMLLTGRAPYDYTNAGQVITAHLVKPPPRTTEVRSDLPAVLDEVIARAMAKQPDERFASCGEFVAAARAAFAVEFAPAPRRVAPTVLAQPLSAPSHPVATTPVSPGAPVPVQSIPSMQYVPGLPSSRPARRGPRKALIAVGGILGVIVVLGVAAATFLPGLIAQWDTREWGSRNQALAETFPQLVSSREFGKGWLELQCIAAIPGQAPGLLLEDNVYVNGISCEDADISHYIKVFDFGSPDAAKAYIDGTAALPGARVWNERHPDLPTPLPIVSHGSAGIGTDILTGFPDDPVRGRFVINFYKKGDALSAEQVIENMWRKAPLGR
ncbi:serine/threonine-protein kinase [Nocardia sp. NPDC058499]|uniref:serine/threonine-protein kinase n=1 Tax=Nocardia sp. NPDC058499 TaxID=3346530 RepID=UPI00365187C5